MELLQLLQWIYGDVGSISTLGTCTDHNRIFTYVSFAYIFVQPLAFSCIGWIHYGSKGTVFPRLTIFLAVCFVGFVINFIVWNKTSTNLHYNYQLVDSTIGNTTCTFVGDNGHLRWMYYGGHPDYHSNNLMYLVLSILVFTFYEKDLFVIPFSWGLTLLITITFFDYSLAEIPSFWCLMSALSIPIGVVISIYEYYKNGVYGQSKKYPTKNYSERRCEKYGNPHEVYMQE